MATTSGHPLPPIGRPTTRALAELGISQVDQLQQHRAADLLALHGVGPNAVSILDAALAERGWSFLTSAQALPADVQAYIDAVPASHRAEFDRLHEIVTDELPAAEVVISYKMPLVQGRQAARRAQRRSADRRHAHDDVDRSCRAVPSLPERADQQDEHRLPAR